MHDSGLLWRGLQQMHHSAKRLDTFGAFWFSPLDMIGWTAVGSLSLVLLVGGPTGGDPAPARHHLHGDVPACQHPHAPLAGYLIQ